jgi:hypothetical protein
MGVRKLASRVPKGVQAGERLAAEKLRGAAPGLLPTEPRAAVSRIFDQVAKSGVKIASEGLDTSLMDPDQFRVFMREIRQIPAGPDFPPGLGSRMAGQFEALRKGEKIDGFDIGELQQVSSRLKKAGRTKKEGAVQDVLTLGARLVDETIESGRIAGPATRKTIDLLKDGRAKWKAIVQSDDLASMAMAVTTRTKGGRITIHLGKLKGLLEGAPQRGTMGKAAEVLRQRPETKRALADLVKRFDKINIEGSSTGSGFGIVERAAYALLGVLGAAPMARGRFMRLVEKKRGVLAMEDLTLILNQARREAEALGLGAGGSEAGAVRALSPTYPPTQNFFRGLPAPPIQR